jgi:excisionase family DNA binding protein
MINNWLGTWQLLPFPQRSPRGPNVLAPSDFNRHSSDLPASPRFQGNSKDRGGPQPSSTLERPKPPTVGKSPPGTHQCDPAVSCSDHAHPSEDLAKRLGASVVTVRKWAREGQIPCMGVGGRFIRLDWDAVINAMRAPAEGASLATRSCDTRKHPTAGLPSLQGSQNPASDLPMEGGSVA